MELKLFYDFALKFLPSSPLSPSFAAIWRRQKRKREKEKCYDLLSEQCCFCPSTRPSLQVFSKSCYTCKSSKSILLVQFLPHKESNPSSESRLSLSQLSSSFLVAHVLICYFAYFASLPASYRALGSWYFIWAFLFFHFLMLLLGPDGLCAVTHLFSATCVLFSTLPWLSDPSLPSRASPALTTCLWPWPGCGHLQRFYICCSSSPGPSSSLCRHSSPAGLPLPHRNWRKWGRKHGWSTLEQMQPPQ